MEPYFLNMFNNERMGDQEFSSSTSLTSVCNEPRVNELLDSGTLFKPDIFGRTFEQISYETDGLHLRGYGRGHPLGRDIIVRAHKYPQDVSLRLVQGILDQRIQKWEVKDDTWLRNMFEGIQSLQ